jgi:hypothetical protein
LDEESLFDDHQISQREQGVQLRSVLGQAAIAQLFMVEPILDDVEGVLDPSPHLRQRPLDWLDQIPQALGQGFDDVY